MTAEADAVLSAVSISRHFGGLAALTDVTLHVKPGQVRGVIGPNGAGKTTLLNVLSGLQQPHFGRVHIAGRDVTGWSTRRIVIEAGVARTFQTAKLFSSMSAFDNVLVAAGLRSRRKAEAIAAQMIQQFGLAAVAQQSATLLSYGLQRRVELARAMATRPKVLLLDEPAAGLNPSERSDLAEHLNRVAAEGIAIILVEHQMDLVHAICSEMTVLDFGRVIAAGSVSTTMNHPAVIEAYVGTSAKPTTE